MIWVEIFRAQNPGFFGHKSAKIEKISKFQKLLEIISRHPKKQFGEKIKSKSCLEKLWVIMGRDFQSSKSNFLWPKISENRKKFQISKNFMKSFLGTKRDILAKKSSQNHVWKNYG